MAYAAGSSAPTAVAFHWQGGAIRSATVATLRTSAAAPAPISCAPSPFSARSATASSTAGTTPMRNSAVFPPIYSSCIYIVNQIQMKSIIINIQI